MGPTPETTNLDANLDRSVDRDAHVPRPSSTPKLVNDSTPRSKPKSPRYAPRPVTYRPTNAPPKAFENLILTANRAARPDTVEVVLLVDAKTLVGGVHGDTVCEYTTGTPTTVENARRLYCNAATIYTATLNDNGELLNLGRSKRQATRAQRRALRTQYTTCAFDQCTIRFDRCEIHHVDRYEHGGLTDYSNLVPLCAHHHHQVHEGQWRLTIDPTRTITIWRPDGQQHTQTPHTPTYQPRSRREHRQHERTVSHS